MQPKMTGWKKRLYKSDPKGGEEWYVVNGRVLNPAFEVDENQYKTLPFVVKGRITESEYKELRSLLGSRLTEEPSSTIWTDLLFSFLPSDHRSTLLFICSTA